MDLPGWNSIQTTGTLSNVFFWISIAALLMLGIAEVFSHRYGEQRDRLVSQQEAAEKKASDKEIAQLQLETARANARAAEAQLALEKLKTPRTLGPARQQFVTAQTAPFKGQRYRTAISQGADDGLAFWESLYLTLDKAGWVYLPASPPSMGNPPAGIPLAAIPGVEIRFDPAKEKQEAPAALALGNALHAHDGMVVAVNRDKQSNPNTAEQDVLLIVIGARVAPP